MRDSGGRPVAGATVHLQVKEVRGFICSLGRGRELSLFRAARRNLYLARRKGGIRPSRDRPLRDGPNEAKRVDLTLEAPKVLHAQSAAPAKSGAGSPEFFDEPQFTVAGVTDGTNLGGHGSNTVVRTKESLAKDIASLSPSAEKAPVAGLPPTPSSTGAPAQPIPPLQEEAGQHHLLGDIEEKSGDPLEAVREYQRAAELDPSEPNFFDWGAELLLHRAVEPAIEVFGKGDRLFPHSARMLVGLGVAWYSNGSYDQAAQRLCEASDLNPAIRSLPVFGQDTKRRDHAVRMFGRAAGTICEASAGKCLANYYYAVNLWKQRKGPDDPKAWRRSSLC